MINHYLGMAERITVNLKRRRRRSVEDAVLEPLAESESECEVEETERRVVRRVVEEGGRGSADWFLDLLAE